MWNDSLRTEKVWQCCYAEILNEEDGVIEYLTKLGFLDCCHNPLCWSSVLEQEDSFLQLPKFLFFIYSASVNWSFVHKAHHNTCNGPQWLGPTAFYRTISHDPFTGSETEHHDWTHSSFWLSMTDKQSDR